MTALSKDLSIEQGTSWSHGFLPQINSQPIVSTGWTARAQARIAVTDAMVLHEWTTDDNTIVVDGASGTVTLFVDPEDSSAWPWRAAVYDLEISSPDGKTTYRIAQGRITVSPEVTR